MHDKSLCTTKTDGGLHERCLMCVFLVKCACLLMNGCTRSARHVHQIEVDFTTVDSSQDRVMPLLKGSAILAREETSQMKSRFCHRSVSPAWDAGL